MSDHFNARPLLDRASEKFLVADSGCWEWMASLTHDGYGRLWVDGKTKMAHRAIYELVVGAVPEEMQLDHLCQNTRCVNPDHLEVTTAVVNTRRARAKATCKYGHPFVPENRYYSGSKSTCRPCNVEWQRSKRKGVA